MGGCLGSPTANKPYGQQGYGGYPQQQGYGGYPQQQGYGAPGQYGHNFQPNYGPQAGEFLAEAAVLPALRHDSACPHRTSEQVSICMP